MPSVIPLHLRVSGFLSYRDPAELDFTGFDLACISGPNGAGKSTLLDAITWALFGQARRRDESLINLQSDAAEVVFTFRYEQSDYRILRSLRRGKAGVLEFQARGIAGSADGDSGSTWKPLTERTQRDTQARIEQVLRLDYETFVNASFFLQGKADSFAQQSPARRKEVLGNILGMELWESYKARAAELRRGREAELAAVTGRLGEIDTELGEEAQRRQRLEELEIELARSTAARKAQASSLEGARKTHDVHDRQRTLHSEQRASLDRLRSEHATMQSRSVDRQDLHAQNAGLAGRADEIQAAFEAWKHTRTELEQWDASARSFSDHESKRAPLLQAIATEQARIEQERAQLLLQQQQAADRASSVVLLESELQQATALLEEAERGVQERDQLQQHVARARETVAEKAAENKALKDKMDELKSRIEVLEAASGAACPLCGQPLSDSHRKSTLKRLQAEGKQHGDKYRLNLAAVQSLRDTVAGLEVRLASFAGADDLRLQHSRTAAQLAERLGLVQAELKAWESAGLARLAEVSRLLETADFAHKARQKLAALDAQLSDLGYDAGAHDAVRIRELEQRGADELHSRLLSARAALAPLDDEIRNLEKQLTERGRAIAIHEAAVEKLQLELDSAGADLPDLAQVERVLFELQEQENRLNQEVGAARQKVAVLDGLRQRSAEMVSARQSLALNIGRHKALETAFGKDGVQALLIEQALPEVETRANEILDRLSDGRMSVHFETQAAYRDRKREDLKETLDIKISDGAGQRDYEMYSGGEAFRVNFAIRLALSQVLAGRKGARLQTLVIDEGFGSQDNQGIQRLIETINLVRHDFAKILLISHLEELKDAFPTRIEVEKGERGSTLTVS
jgi:exonuclease SbcC